MVPPRAGKAPTSKPGLTAGRSNRPPKPAEISHGTGGDSSSPNPLHLGPFVHSTPSSEMSGANASSADGHRPDARRHRDARRIGPSTGLGTTSARGVDRDNGHNTAASSGDGGSAHLPTALTAEGGGSSPRGNNASRRDATSGNSGSGKSGSDVHHRRSDTATVRSPGSDQVREDRARSGAKATRARSGVQGAQAQGAQAQEVRARGAQAPSRSIGRKQANVRRFDLNDRRRVSEPQTYRHASSASHPGTGDGPQRQSQHNRDRGGSAQIDDRPIADRKTGALQPLHRHNRGSFEVEILVEVQGSAQGQSEGGSENPPSANGSRQIDLDFQMSMFENLTSSVTLLDHKIDHLVYTLDECRTKIDSNLEVTKYTTSQLETLQVEVKNLKREFQLPATIPAQRTSYEFQSLDPEVLDRERVSREHTGFTGTLFSSSVPNTTRDRMPKRESFPKSPELSLKIIETSLRTWMS